MPLKKKDIFEYKSGAIDLSDNGWLKQYAKMAAKLFATIKIARYTIRFQFCPIEEKCFSNETKKLMQREAARSSSTIKAEMRTATKASRGWFSR